MHFALSHVQNYDIFILEWSNCLLPLQ